MPHDMHDDIQDKLNLIQQMIAEGRRTTQSWGWAFVLWGIAYYAAIAWSAWGHTIWAWPVISLLAAFATFLIAVSRTRRDPRTTLGRAVGTIWISSGMTFSLLFPALGFSGRLTDAHLFIAVVSGILGMANGASALLLRWRVQLACAALWWLTAVVSCFATEQQATIAFLVAIFLCQIVFGIYGMISETRPRGQHQTGDRPAHA